MIYTFNIAEYTIKNSFDFYLHLLFLSLFHLRLCTKQLILLYQFNSLDKCEYPSIISILNEDSSKQRFQEKFDLRAKFLIIVGP